MIKIRYNCFETNSSSTHSIIMCMTNDYKKFKNGELLLYEDGRLVTYEDALALMKQAIEKHEYTNEKSFLSEINEHTKEEIIDFMEENDYAYRWENWPSEEYYYFEEEYQTPNNESVTAFGYYGNNY